MEYFMIMMTSDHHFHHYLRYLKTPKNTKKHSFWPFLDVYGSPHRLYGLYVRVVVVKTPYFCPFAKVILGTNFWPNFCTISGFQKFWGVRLHDICPKSSTFGHFHDFQDLHDHECHGFESVKIWCWFSLWKDFWYKSTQIWKNHDIFGPVTKMSKISLKCRYPLRYWPLVVTMKNGSVTLKFHDFGGHGHEKSWNFKISKWWFLGFNLSPHEISWNFMSQNLQKHEMCYYSDWCYMCYYSMFHYHYLAVLANLANLAK